MRIHLLSDLHLEFGAFTPPDTDADIVILAGDIAEGTKGIEWAKEAFDCPVIYIADNHEFYTQPQQSTTYSQIQTSLRAAAAGTHIHFLENESISFGDLRFLCCTLWTDFEIYGLQFTGMMAARLALSDFNGAIKTESGFFRPDDALRLHQESKHWLRENLIEPWDGKTVVVTHFLPCQRSIAPRWGGSASNAGFASNMDEFLGMADLWIHGHTHDSMDYELNDCRVVCNPRGYARTWDGKSIENANFNAGLIVDL